MVKGVKELRDLDYPGGLDFKESVSANSCFAPAERASLYIIGWREQGPLKFGVARDPVSRLSELQTANPNRLRIFAAWWLHSEPAAYAVETGCLEQTAGLRMAGEWSKINLMQAKQIAKAVFSYFGYQPERWKPSQEQITARNTQLACQRKAQQRAKQQAARSEFEWLRNETRRR